MQSMQCATIDSATESCYIWHSEGVCVSAALLVCCTAYIIIYRLPNLAANLAARKATRGQCAQGLEAKCVGGLEAAKQNGLQV